MVTNPKQCSWFFCISTVFGVQHDLIFIFYNSYCIHFAKLYRGTLTTFMTIHELNGGDHPTKMPKKL